MKKVVGVSFNDSNKIYYFMFGNLKVNRDDYVIVETEKGLQFGNVTTSVIEVDEKKLNKELKKIVRIATSDDFETNEKNLLESSKALKDAEKFVKQLNLDMRILNANFTFDRKQLIFNFMADERVDFRELAKKLAGIYKTRIELRQIGVRDKAKCVGGYGQCGKKLCCATFLNDINSVSINMAKNQNLALNPQKINGVCGRLMCCLSYENDNYSEYKKGLPKIGEKINYKDEKCKVINVDIFNRTYKIETPDSKIIELKEGEKL